MDIDGMALYSCVRLYGRCTVAVIVLIGDVAEGHTDNGGGGEELRVLARSWELDP